MSAINTLAVPVVPYSYRVIDWKLDEIEDLDRITRKQLCMNRMLSRKADVDRIYLPYLEGGRCLMSLEKKYKATMIGIHKYMIKVTPRLLPSSNIRHPRLCTLFQKKLRNISQKQEHKKIFEIPSP